MKRSNWIFGFVAMVVVGVSHIRRGADKARRWRNGGASQHRQLQLFSGDTHGEGRDTGYLDEP